MCGQENENITIQDNKKIIINAQCLFYFLLSCFIIFLFSWPHIYLLLEINLLEQFHDPETLSLQLICFISKYAWYNLPPNDHRIPHIRSVLQNSKHIKQDEIFCSDRCIIVYFVKRQSSKAQGIESATLD